MKFNFECDETDGLVMIDESYLNEINSDILYAFDIFLDKYGKTELIYDFPNEKWEVIREREITVLKNFCNTGKMIVFLSENNVSDCEIEFVKGACETDKFLKIPSGKMILINASELIQCLAYPDLNMEKILVLDVEKGMYAINNEGIKRISCYKAAKTKSSLNNVVEL